MTPTNIAIKMRISICIVNIWTIIEGIADEKNGKNTPNIIVMGKNAYILGDSNDMKELMNKIIGFFSWEIRRDNEIKRYFRTYKVFI